MRVPFDDVFSRDGVPNAVVAKVPIEIAGVAFAPGVLLVGSLQIGNVRIADMIGRDLEVEVDGGLTIITAWY